MNRETLRRLERLEVRHGDGPEPITVMISPIDIDGTTIEVQAFTTAVGYRWDRLADEAMPDFTVKVESEAQALPNRPHFIMISPGWPELTPRACGIAMFFRAVRARDGRFLCDSKKDHRWTIKLSCATDTGHGVSPTPGPSASPSPMSAATCVVEPGRGQGRPVSAATCMHRAAAAFMVGYRPARSRDRGRSDRSRRESRSPTIQWRTPSSGRSCAARGYAVEPYPMRG